MVVSIRVTMVDWSSLL